MKKTLEDYGFPSNYSIENKYQVYDFLTNIYLDISQTLFKQNVFLKCFPLLYENIINYIQYPESFSFSQKLYHYFNDDKELKLGLCKECGKRTKYLNFRMGYQPYCCKKCANSNYDKKENCKQTCLDKYGTESYTQTDEYKEKSKQTCLERYGVEHYVNIEKNKQTCLDRYGVENYTQTDEYKEKSKQTCLDKYRVENYSQTEEYKEKSKQTCLDKYGVENYAQTDEMKEKSKQTCLDKYGVENYTQTEEYLKKCYKTKKKNHSFSTSSIEEQFANFLKENNYNFERQYRSELYPFDCDFYISDYNLYIEIQGFWTHGKHPYDKNSIEDNLILENWKSKNTKFYKNAIEVWTIRDVKKREIAKTNDLNYLEIFSDSFEICKERLKLYEEQNFPYDIKYLDLLKAKI